MSDFWIKIWEMEHKLLRAHASFPIINKTKQSLLMHYFEAKG